MLSAKPQFELLGRNELGDRSSFDASPAVDADRILLRSDKYLYCLQEGGIPAGFVSLFDGTTLDGWQMREAGNRDRRVVDGTIDCDPHPGAGDRNLWTRQDFKNFELLIDWRIKEAPYTNRAAKIILPEGTYRKDPAGKEELAQVPNVDSGVFLRGQHKSQVNIWCWNIGSGEVWGYRTDSSVSPAVRAGVTPKTKADRPIGEWNTFLIKLGGERLWVKLNGQPVIEDAHLPGIPGAGPLALQHHGDRKDGEWGASFVQFRRIYIRELPNSAPPDN